MIPRLLGDHLLHLAQGYPILSLTGPRQSGKTTLVKALFSDYAYVNLENLDERLAAEEDPRRFLRAHTESGVIIDEAQRVPGLFSYLQGMVDESGKMGLQQDALDLMVRCYARWSARTLVSGGEPFEAAGGKGIPEHVVLARPDLPTHADWAAALQMAGVAFGVTLPGKALHADNLKRFESELNKKLKEVASACSRLPALLRQRMAESGMTEEADRLVTALSADSLCAALAGKAGRQQVEGLAGFEPHTSGRALLASVGSAGEVAAMLEDDLVFGPFSQLDKRRDALTGAAELLDQMAASLRQDELNIKLAPRLRELAEQAQRLLNPPAPAGEVVYNRTLSRRGREAVLAEVEEALQAVKAALEECTEEVTLSGQLTLVDLEKR